MATLLIIIIVALVTGSALTVLLEDTRGSSFFSRARSQCPRCRHLLGVRDLVPLASYLLLRGRCRHCQATIPRWHFLTEALTLALFLLAYASGARGLPLVFLLGILATLGALSIMDLRFWILPDWLVLLLAVVGMTRSVIFETPLLLSSLIGGALGLALLGGMVAGTRGRAMGLGDVKLAGAMGVVLGWEALLGALAVAFVAGGIVGMALIVAKRATMKSHLPFGPFLATGTVVVLLLPDLPTLAFTVIRGGW